MKEIIMKNVAGVQSSVNVVRFFRLNGIEYLIFSLNEVDEGGYVKLYVSKITEGIGNTIEDDVEWNLIKDTIKTVIKSNKDNLPLPITDLDTNRINNLQILDQKIFKLNDSLLQLLTANKKEEFVAPSNNQVESQENVVNVAPAEEIRQDSGITIESLPKNTTTPFPNFTFENPTSNVNSYNNDENLQTSYNLNASINQTTEYALDYKTLYENELKKNEELIKEADKYKNIIDSLKKILNEDI